MCFSVNFRGAWLSSYELATDVVCSTIRDRVATNYPEPKVADLPVRQSTKHSGNDNEVFLKKLYKEMSKCLSEPKRSTDFDDDYETLH